ncbi:hypothetical protein DPMN_129983 [Dreissena polymorpha]|uniref:Uncharacterized protein n=1 Tax=Dreissena polymorpha TaxID=45954 RepID=A0A9D4JYR8_DREPO|nr:hypothetical protein DPMN_129983 [Dreissena polymorpha]
MVPMIYAVVTLHLIPRLKSAILGFLEKCMDLVLDSVVLFHMMLQLLSVVVARYMIQVKMAQTNVARTSRTTQLLKYAVTVKYGRSQKLVMTVAVDPKIHLTR